MMTNTNINHHLSSLSSSSVDTKCFPIGADTVCGRGLPLSVGWLDGCVVEAHSVYVGSLLRESERMTRLRSVATGLRGSRIRRAAGVGGAKAFVFADGTRAGFGDTASAAFSVRIDFCPSFSHRSYRRVTDIVVAFLISGRVLRVAHVREAHGRLPRPELPAERCGRSSQPKVAVRTTFLPPPCTFHSAEQCVRKQATAMHPPPHPHPLSQGRYKH